MVSTKPTSRYGRGFIVNISHIMAKFSLPPEQAWPGVQDYFTDFVLPKQFKGTEVEMLTDLLRQKIMWHQPGGPVDQEMYTDVKRLISRIVVSIDREMGIMDADIGQYHV
ncbi:MAG: hypothetical protein LUQ07_06155 [Methanospirillum sp.]|nr:hypothetical protein [Methanospirillum sp.]